MLPIPTDIIEKLNDGYYLAIDDGKTVWIHFDSGTIGFASELLWDKNVRETFRKNYEVD